MPLTIINESRVLVPYLQEIIHGSGIEETDLLVYVDSRENRVRREAASARIRENEGRGWQPSQLDLEIIANADSDYHACFSCWEVIRDQAFPVYVKEAVPANNSLIYLDRLVLGEPPLYAVSTIAHECRHAWKYYRNPAIYFGHLVLEWVMSPNETPAELDAEVYCKRIAVDLLGAEAVSHLAQARIESSAPERREFWKRFLRINPHATTDVVGETRNLPRHHANDLRRMQESLNITIPWLKRAASCLSADERAHFLGLTERVT